MRSTFVLTALALAVPSVLAFGDVEIANSAELPTTDSTTSLKDAASATSPEEVLVTTLSDVQSDKSHMVVVEAPPMFDPPEPRPGSIFVDEDGKIIDSLLQPPPISFARPEVISAFEGSHVHPASSPFPPDSYEMEYNEALYPRSAWIHATSIIGGLAILLSIATILVWFVERMVFSLWRGSKRMPTVDPIDMWYEQNMLEKALPRRRSFSAAADILKKC